MNQKPPLNTKRFKKNHWFSTVSKVEGHHRSSSILLQSIISCYKYNYKLISDRYPVIGNKFKNSVWHTFHQVLHDVRVQVVSRYFDRSAQFLYVVELHSVSIYLSHNVSPEVLSPVRVR